MAQKIQQTDKATWDAIWRGTSLDDVLEGLSKERQSSRWHIIRELVIQNVGPIQGLRIIEIGAGTGKVAALFAQEGAEVTILDISEVALRRAKDFYRQLGIKPRFIKADALKLAPALKGAFDVSLSIGLIEHFRGKHRKRILDAHFELINGLGLTILSSPNKWCLPYLFFKHAQEWRGKFGIDIEIPFTAGELRRYATLTKRKVVFLGGASNFMADMRNFIYQLAKSLALLSPILARIAKRRSVRRRSAAGGLSGGMARERKGPLDSAFGYILLLVAKR